MRDIAEIVIYLEESGLLNKGVSETIDNEATKKGISGHVNGYIRCYFLEKYVSR